MTLPFPKGVLAQHTILLGKTRSGKSSTMRVMVEALLDDKKPVCIVDPKGDWWGIKSSADGKKPGYDVVIFGGSHADVPINPQSGKVVAELVATGNRPALIDLGGWMVGDRTRFFIDFASTLFVKTHGHRWLAIDECHNFAPQGKVIDPQAGMSLHWANRLASEGAGKGLVLISASQRPQKVHKDYLTSHETLIGKRVIHKLDRDALRDWIDACGDPEQGKEVLRTLAGLQRSQGWVYSPEIEFGPKLVDFPMFKTYDSFAPQTGAQGRKLKGWASVDLDQVKEKLASVVEEAKANDPRELRAEVARLKAENAKLQSAAASPAAAKPDKDAIAAAEKKGFEQAEKKLTASMERELQKRTVELLSGLGDKIGPLMTFLSEQIREVKAKRFDAGDVTFSPSAAAPVPRAVPAVPPQTASRAKPATSNTAPRQQAEGELNLTGTKQAILDAIAWTELLGAGAASKMMVAFLADSSPKSSTFEKYVSQLRTAGLIVSPRSGEFSLTDEGRACANQQQTPPDHDAMMASISRKLTDGQLRIVKGTTAVYPHEISKDDLAVAAGMSANSSTFEKYVSQMRSLGLIESPVPKMFKASDRLFPERMAA